jgi:fructose-1,6-bisphosphatase/inositol monophosphatase family enzyme
MQKQIDLKKALEQCSKKIVELADYAYKNWYKIQQAEYHDNVDFSTEYDKLLEKKMHKFLMKNFPGTGFIGEEFPELVDKKKDFVWLFDPIDGTKYFGKQVPFFSSTLALEYKGEGLIGIVYNPISEQLYTAIKGKGAYENGKKITCSSLKLKDSIINVELDIGDDAFMKKWIGNKLDILRLNVARLRVFALTSNALCWIAKGALGGYLDLFGMVQHDKYVDMAAGLLICKEAGVNIYKFEPRKGDSKMIVAPPGTDKEIIKLLKIKNAKKI